jgi:hypothetical protein
VNNVNLHTQPPVGISPQQMEAAFNNKQAQALALGDPRGALKRGNLIRPGLSVGGAQMNQAGIQGASEMANAVADAYSQDLQQGSYNAGLQLQGQQANEQYAQALAGLQQQSAYGRQSDAMQRQGAALGLVGNLLGGLLR